MQQHDYQQDYKIHLGTLERWEQQDVPSSVTKDPVEAPLLLAAQVQPRERLLGVIGILKITTLPKIFQTRRLLGGIAEAIVHMIFQPAIFIED
jgi:hypothetical protein